MLLDVAPTILKYAGVERPATFEGCELQPILAGQPAPCRIHYAETVRMLEGRILKTVMAPPAKLIYNLADGAMEFYELPDEINRQPDTRIPPALRTALQQWVDEDPYWLVHIKGSGRWELTAHFPHGRIAVFVPVGLNPESEEIEAAPEGSKLAWVCYPAGGAKRLFLRADPADALPSVTAKKDGGVSETNVFWRTARGLWSRDPALMSPVAAATTAIPPVPGQDGIYIERRGARPKSQRGTRASQLDEKTIRQLRSLGYMQ